MRSDNLTYLIAKVHRLLHNQLDEKLRNFDITVEQWRVLYQLRDNSAQSMGDLASTVLMNHPALTKMIDRMVANGFVHRAPDISDQRRVVVHLTDRGKALVERVKRSVEVHEAQVTSVIGAANFRALEALLENVAARSPIESLEA